MAKNFPNLVIGYGTKTGATSRPGGPIFTSASSAGQALVDKIRSTR